MGTESALRVGFWVLFGGVLAMRVYFMLQVRRAGERVMPDRGAIKREGGLAFGIRILMFVLLLVWLVLYAINPGWMELFSVPFPGWLRWVGFGLGVASLAFWVWTQAALGKEWSPQLQLRKEHRLVTTGPYARIRHPLYTSMICYGVSLGLVTANWVFLVLAVLAIAGLVIRVPKEEKMMIEEFGEEYTAYMQRTARFFPK